MRVLYIHQYFKTPNEPGGTRSYWISRKLIEKGHEVIMLTSRNNMDKSSEHLSIDGINVIYLNVRYDQKMGLFKRFISFLSFMVKTIKIVFILRNNYDKIYATSTPLSVGIPAIIAKTFLNKPYIFEIRDLWPEVPIQMGAVRNKGLIFFLRKLERLIYLKAEKIISLSPGMKKGVLKSGIDKAKVFMVPNMSKPDVFYPRSKNHEIFNKFKLNEKSLTVIYFGAIGKSNGLKKVVEFFHKVQDQKIQLIIAGDGSEKRALQSIIDVGGIKNVKLLGNYSTKIISELVNCCDLSLVSFDKIPILYTNSPNKFFDALSAGKPIIVNSPGWIKKLVVDHDCGFFYEYDGLESFKEMINEIVSKPEKLKVMGLNSRKLCENKFDKELLTNEIVNLF